MGDHTIIVLYNSPIREGFKPMKEVNPMETPNRFSATLIIRLAFAIENGRFAIKRRLLAVLTVVIWLSFLICSLAAWPSVERMLLVKMTGAIIESANDEKLPELIHIGEEIWPRKRSQKA